VNNVTTFSTVSCSTHGAMGDTQNVKFFECKKHACEAISSSCKLSVLKVLDFLYLFIFLSVVGDCSTTLQWCKWCTHRLTSFTFLGSLKKGLSICQHYGMQKKLQNCVKAAIALCAKHARDNFCLHYCNGKHFKHYSKFQLLYAILQFSTFLWNNNFCTDNCNNYI